MIFLTTGEKIRTLRKKYGMRQQELEDENITRAFISMIETGKRGLSKDTAKLIAEKLNRKALDIGIVLNIDEAYLLRTPAEDAEEYCLQKLNNMPTQDEVEVIIDISKKYELTNVEAAAYKVLGDYDYEKKNFLQAFINFMISLDLYKNTENKNLFAYLFNKLGLSKLKRKEFAESISFFNRAIYYAELYNDEDIRRDSLYNLAKANESLNRIDEALNYVEIYLQRYKCELKLENYVFASILKAKCYYNKGNRDKAHNTYTEILKCFEDENSLLIDYVYNSIGELYKQEGNLEKSLDYFNKAEQIRELKNKKVLSCTLIAKSKVYIKLANYEEALRFADNGLKLSLEYNLIEDIVDAYKLLVEIYTELRDFSGIKNIYIKLLDVLKNKEQYKEETIKIYNKLALWYLDQNDIEMCKKYLHMVS